MKVITTSVALPEWTCQNCGVENERDWNASKNIEKEALRLIESRRGSGYVETLNAHGRDVRLPSSYSV